jgi:hypothetical protein
MASEFIAGLGIFKTLLDSAKGLKDINDAAVRNAAVIELQEKILTAREQQFAALERIAELEKEMARFETWEAEQQRYELKPVPGYHKPLAYALKEEAERSEPSHWLCATCFQNRKASVLQPEVRSPGRCQVLVCHECGADHYLNGDRVSSHPTSTKRR